MRNVVVTLVLFLCCLGSLGCSPEDESRAKYTVQIVSLPDTAAPNHSFDVVVQVLTSEGEPVTNATVGISAIHAVESEVATSLTETAPGTYAGNILLEGLGSWGVQINAVDSKGQGSLEANVEVACGEAGVAGEVCCQTKNCAGELFCVLGLCAEEKGVDGADCHVDSDCQSNDCDAGQCAEAQAPLLGVGDGTPLSVTWTTILDTDLSDPTALGFNPSEPNELWVTNLASESFTVIAQTGQPEQSIQNFKDYSHHFSERLMSISFGDQGTFATCNDTRNDYHGYGAPNGMLFDDFMGPVHWPAIANDFIKYACNLLLNPFCPDASNVHLDMLHNTPYCMGVAAAGGNRYFTFNGLMGSVELYDFKEPHSDGIDGHGGVDHYDGTKHRYVSLGLKRVANVPSNMVLHPENDWLYIADTGNGRIVRMDPGSGISMGMQNTYPDEQPIFSVGDATVEDVVPEDAYFVFQPSGLVFHGGFMYVSDNANGLISGFDMEGNRVNLLDTGLGEGALAGIAVGPDERLYLVDRLGNRVLRVDPAE